MQLRKERHTCPTAHLHWGVSAGSSCTPSKTSQHKLEVRVAQREGQWVEFCSLSSKPVTTELLGDRQRAVIPSHPPVLLFQQHPQVGLSAPNQTDSVNLVFLSTSTLINSPQSLNIVLCIVFQPSKNGKIILSFQALQ